jgi:hypothetical protein
MQSGKGSKGVLKRGRRCWLVPLLAGLGLVTAVIAVSASSTAPEAIGFSWAKLSASGWFAAYPHIDKGANGLVAALWTEGNNIDDKHNGALRLAWVDNAGTQWTAVTIDNGPVFDADLAVSGSTIHVVWSRSKNTIRYTTCQGPDYSCAPSKQIATANEIALQVDIVVDDSGTTHVIWVEDDGKVHYMRRAGSTWPPEGPQDIVRNSGNVQEGPAIAYANGFVHLAWTEWMDVEHTNSEIKYCRRGVSETDWSLCTSLARWILGDYLARNVSIAADTGGNVYVVWDLVSEDDPGIKREYAIGYRHATDNGGNWRTTHTYPDGNQYGESAQGAQIFISGEGANWIEYVQFLRPYVSLAMSGTATVPVLSWHAQAEPKNGGEVIASNVAGYPHKVYWTYARQPGSYARGPADTGYMFWASEYFTVSTDLCGDVDMGVSSATGRLAVVGDLNEILDGESPGNHLHAVYHEETNGGFWGAFYNNTSPPVCFHIDLPILLKSASIGGDD